MIMLYVFYVGFVVGRYLWSLSKADNQTILEVDCTGETNEQEVISIPLSDDHNHMCDLAERLSKPLTLFFYFTIPSVRSENIVYSPIRKDLENLDLQSEKSFPDNEELQRSESPTPVHVLHPQRYINCLLRRQSDYEAAIGTNSACHPIVYGTEQIVGIFRANLCRALLCILICIIYIGIFASLIVQASSIIVTHIGLSQTTIGATFVSLGTEVSILFHTGITKGQ